MNSTRFKTQKDFHRNMNRRARNQTEMSQWWSKIPILTNKNEHFDGYIQGSGAPFDEPIRSQGTSERKSRPSGVVLAAFKKVREWGREALTVCMYILVRLFKIKLLSMEAKLSIYDLKFCCHLPHTPTSKHTHTRTHSIRRYHMAISCMGMACEPVTDVLLWKQTVAGWAQCGEVVLQQGIWIPGRVNPAVCLAPGPGSGCLYGAGGARPSALGSAVAAAERGWRQSPRDEAW